MSNALKNGSPLEKWLTLGTNGSHLENGSNLKKYTWVTLGKMGHTWKKGVTLGKMGHTCKNGSHLKKWVTLGEMDHT